MPEGIVAKCHKDGSEVAQELMKCRRLGCERFVEKWPDAVEHSVAKFMINDIARQAGVDALLPVVEPIELQRLAGPVVIGVLAVSGMGNYDQSIAFECPTDPAAEPKAAFEEIERILNNRPHAELMELGTGDCFFVERRAVGPVIAVRL